MRRLMILALGATLAYAANASAQSDPKLTRPQPAEQTQVGPNFVDNDGDGICDRYQDRSQTRAGKGRRRGGYGPADGTGNQGVGPRDGTGYGPGPGTNCDGTGPKGQGRRGPRR
ncbi:MAG TPA: hypothetical protein VKA01_08210 [Vicinamibacteria bacterium]|nr:hypothetical protein [Vicinamibacteria bacterium]